MMMGRGVSGPGISHSLSLDVPVSQATTHTQLQASSPKFRLLTRRYTERTERLYLQGVDFYNSALRLVWAPAAPRTEE
jgi:hypothetical protein